MNRLLLSALASLSLAGGVAAQNNSMIIETDAWSWHGDTITQGIFSATAPSPYKIVSNYYAKPGYFMPIDQVWECKNELSSYPQLTTSNRLHAAIYNMGLDEMVNNVEPDTTLRTGKEWAGVWTRDVSYSIILSMAYLQPEASKISLMKKVNANGRIIQDTGSGGAWPISSDRMIWAVAAWELYKVTGERSWLEYIYPVIVNTFADDFQTVYGTESGLVRGETSFIDWREQSYPRWMQTADIYMSEALGTSVVHAEALHVLSLIATELGHKKDAEKYQQASEKLARAINETLWMPSKGYYAMYRYGRANLITNPRAETLGESLAILFDVASPERAVSITENNPVTPFGAAIFYPQIADIPAYHNNALWPFVGSYWALANAKARNEEGTMLAIGSVFRPAALFATNKENFNLDNGDIETELNSSNMLWSLAGNLAITYRILFGVHFESDGLRFAPFVPKAMADTRTLSNFKYRNADITLTVEGFGDKIAECTINGKKSEPFVAASKAKGKMDIRIKMADNEIAPLRVNRTANLKAPLTPIARLNRVAGIDVLQWNPIEYIAGYKVLRNGEVVAETRRTEYNLTAPGEYQVVGVDSNGIESFASEPVIFGAVDYFAPASEVAVMVSPEVSYAPANSISGYIGKGFVETDHNTPALKVPVRVDTDGTYLIALRYANGNGPVNTENKAAIRTVAVDGKRAGIVVMPHRGVGNWDDWGMSNYVEVPLSAGTHEVEISFKPENENMNLKTNHALIDEVVVVKK